ncbi:C40 family peptidase [Piscinibacter sp. XHJ-5]|uniref:C40 family peptidase n=1 Tax=Piscinibacter sp. XHJ-5 TaxID=3037797 RepID=UPI002452F6BF|nr:C40 family peptidase [Piscinibacter sp. XHJ-5]
MRDSRLPAHPTRAAIAALALLLALPAARAAPEMPGPEAFTRFLAERGLIPAEPAAPRLAERVRDKASDVVLTAMNFLGVHYRRGGSSVDAGFDCSGFTRHIVETSLGLVLPRRADEQASAPGLVRIPREELKPGDLVFFNTLKRTFSHVGIYVGEGKFIHAPRPGGEVRVEDMGFAYWRKRFTGARRLEPLAQAAAVPAAPTAPPSPAPVFQDTATRDL